MEVAQSRQFCERQDSMGAAKLGENVTINLNAGQ